ncbi:MAG: ABC transporter permease, partial [Bacteroidales bacterium]|nr:ABC transporter permease [Bacteroidales bacterium]
FNDRMKDNYYHVRHLRNIVLIVTLVTLIITLIGLIGYLGNEMQSKRREIAIRKVCGATVMEVIKELSLNLSLVMLPAIATGVIAAVIGGRYYLEMIMINSNLITSLSFWIFLAGVMLVIFIIYVVNILYSWKAANENPVEVL